METLNSQPLPDERSIRIQKRNFQVVQIDAIGVGLASAAAPFLPVFLTKLGASNVQVGLLSTMPGITGLFLSIFIGRFLQTRRKIVPWFSFARLVVLSCYALSGLVPFFIERETDQIAAILGIWAFATIPQTMVAVAFSVVMNAVAGPQGRFTLMSRRWSTLGLTTAITVTLAGQVLDRMPFPLNYQVVFLSLSMGGLISYYFSSRIELLDSEPPKQLQTGTIRQKINSFIQLVRSEPAFISFSLKRFVVLSGIALGAPIFPLYFVREVGASNTWIGYINTAQTAIALIGYYFWTRQSRRHGSRFVLLCTTFGVSLYPALTALTQRVELITLFATINGIFSAGLDLVFFDELMKTVPIEYSATFVALAQSMQYLSTIASPMIGTFLADHIGLAGALLVSAALRLAGFTLFALQRYVTHEDHLR